MITIQILRLLNILNVLIIMSNCLILSIVTRLFVAEMLILLTKDQTVKLHVLKVLSPGIISLYPGIMLYQRKIIHIPIFH